MFHLPDLSFLTDAIIKQRLNFAQGGFVFGFGSNGHGKYAALDDETRHARFPLPNPLGKTTSHSTRLQNTAAKSLVIPQAGEGSNESLRVSR